MKKIILILILSSCSVNQKVNYKEQVKALTKLQVFIEQDYELGKIEYGPANNYFLIIETVKNDLNKIKNGK